MDNKSIDNQSLSWGILSTARINRKLFKPIRTSERNELIAVASRSAVKAQAYAAKWDIPQAFGSYQALLDDPEIDVIYISLPNSMHAEWTIRALTAGKHVLCEKPIATSLEEVERMQKAAHEAGKHLAEAFMYRHHPQTIKVKELVETGVLGQVRLIKGEFTFSIKDEEDVRLKPSLGGGSIWDVGCYPISFARFILNDEPQEVFGWQKSGKLGIDEVFAGQMRFAGDVFVQFDSGFRSPYRSRIEIVGSEASMIIPTPFNPGLDVEIQINRGGEIETVSIPGQDPYIGEIEDMADVIMNGSKPQVSLEDSRRNVESILALLHSAEIGKPVSISYAT